MTVALLFLFGLSVAIADTNSLKYHERMLSAFFASKCTACEYVVSQLDKHVPSRGLEEAVSSLCKDTPIDGCTEKMKHSLLQLEASLNGKKAPSQVCHEIGWCRRGQVFQLPQPKVAAARQQAQLETDLACSFCVKGFLAFKKMVEGDKVDGSDSSALLTQLCGRVPDQYKALCAKTNVTKLASMLSEDPLTACEHTHMCRPPVAGSSALRNNVFLMSTPPTISGARCQGCQWAVSAIEAYFAQDTTTDELSRILQELCTVLPGDYAEVCQNFVLVYTPQALGWVIDNLTPPVVCEQINFCGDDDK